MRRRNFLKFLSLSPGGAIFVAKPASPKTQVASTIFFPVEVYGDTRGIDVIDISVVTRRVLKACLFEVRPLSDRLPKAIRIENKSGGPAIWLHAQPQETAWIIIDVAGPYWTQLAYQLGHELGHVLCNSWDVHSKPEPPSQWLEETLAEAFSIRGLSVLADGWEKDPPFPTDTKYAESIRQYRANLIADCMKPVLPDGVPADWRSWAGYGWKPGGPLLGSYDQKGPVTLNVLAEMEADARAVEDLGALNRWADRSRVPVPDYLRLWERSCREIGSSGKLPRRLLRLFDL